MTRSTNGFRVFAICTVCCLTIVGVAHLYLYEASEDAVARSMRYDIAWAGVNGRLEAAHLEKHVARYAALGDKKDADAARLFYDILRGRMELWGAGGFEQFIELSTKRQERFEALRDRVGGLAGDIDRLDEPDVQRRVLQALLAVAPMIDRIGGEAHTTSVAEAAAIRDELHHKQRLQRGLIIALLLSGAAFLVFMVLQNRSLRVAHLAAARQADELSFFANHDALTKLPNRRAFDAAFRTALESRRADEKIAIGAIDLDGFKVINDTIGHAAGDALLVAVSERLVSAATQLDRRNIVCRIGGDEFLALFWLADDTALALDAARQVVELLSQPFETAYGMMMIGASVGVDVSDAATSDELILNADLALTEAKAKGKGIALAFDRKMRAGQLRRLRIEADLDAALAGGQIVPHYQPQIDLASGCTVGVEALARWYHPELGPISPGEFIPIAEGSGAVTRIGRLILEVACQDAARFPENIGVSVNLSVIQILKDDVVAAIRDVLAATGLAPDRLTLEITESVMMTDPEKVLNVLAELKLIGVSVSLDDFGAGYSALGYLTRFAWDELKIDRSFIKRAASDPINLMIIRTVKELAQKMNARVTVEGVETREQRDLLRKIGCDTAQGYLFGHPVPVDELMPFLLRNNTATLDEGDAHPRAASSRLANPATP